MKKKIDTISKMTVKIFLYFYGIILVFLLNSCSVEPGEGGLAMIRGKVYGYDINSAGRILDSGYVGDTRVYIAYGNHTWADDDVRTSYNGEYAFRGLQKGKYTLWVFSQCDTCPFDLNYVKKEVEITSNKQELVVPDFIIFD